MGQLAVELWNLMGGEIDWAALPALVALHDVRDVELLLDWLTCLRDQLRTSNG
jgi:hypothetical protein